MERFIIGSVTGVVSEIAKHTVVPLLSPIARPCKSIWAYEDNFKKLNKIGKKLHQKKEGLQSSLENGVQAPVDVTDWQRQVNDICHVISNLRDERESMSGCRASLNVMKSYKHRKEVARNLKQVKRLKNQLKKSENEWKYKIEVQNLKKKVDDLTDEERRVLAEIKDGDMPLPNVGIWLEKVVTIDTGLINLQPPQQPQEQQPIPDYSLLWNNVARKVSEVERLLQEAKGFKVFAEETEQTKYNKGLSGLKKQVEMLEHKENKVQLRIKPWEAPLPDVKKWLGDVKKFVDELNDLTGGEYNLEKYNKVDTLLEEANRLLEQETQFKDIAYANSPGPINYRFTMQETSQARMSILESVIEKLKQDDVLMLGIYGMGGVGKTTLAKHIGVKAVTDKIVDKVIFAEVSQSPNIKTIQDTIAEALGPKLEGGSESGRAIKLHERLKKVSQDGIEILVILDNLWEEIKLDDIGIPRNFKGVKLLLTARSRHLLSNKMESQHEFNVEALGEEDAWILFKSMAGKCVDHRSLESISKEVAKNCGGMPVAIVPVAKALKHKMSVAEWEDALEKMETPSVDNFEDDITKELYNSMKLSYDCLSRNLKDIFLLCSRLQNTHGASIEDLLKYGFDFGSHTMKKALNRVQSSIKQLKDVSLLQDAPTPSEDRFAVHDTVCNIARSIASSRVFKDDHLPGHVSFNNSLREYASITLSNIQDLPDFFAELKFPNLKFLYMRSEGLRLKVPDNFFQGISSLQVLHLIRMDLSPPPKTFRLLKNLQTLCLELCSIKDVAIGHMEKLEILSFCGSSLKELPREICHLSLRLLDLRDCWNLTHIPVEISSSLTSLEAFYVSSSVSIDKVKNWSNLVILEIDVPDVKICRELRLCNLMRYNISIGSKFWGPFRGRRSRSLTLEHDPKDKWILSQWSDIEALELICKKEGAADLLDNAHVTDFPKLMDLYVGFSDCATCMAYSRSPVAILILQNLRVEEMKCMEKICDSSFAANSFLHLKTIVVDKCMNLSNIFAFSSFLGVLPNLTDLKVSNCENLELIFAIEERSNRKVAPDINLPKLIHLTLKNLPSLKGFWQK